MKLDRTASLSSSLLAACCALVGLSAIGGCMIEPREHCDKHPDDPECAYVTDTYRDHGGGGANSGKGGCAGIGGAGGASRGGAGGTARVVCTVSPPEIAFAPGLRGWQRFCSSRAHD